MTKSQYYKWRSKLRQVHRRQDYDCDYRCESVDEVAKRLFTKRSEEERNILVWSLDSDSHLRWARDLDTRLRVYKLKNQKESPEDMLARKIEEAERNLLIRLNKRLYGG